MNGNVCLNGLSLHPVLGSNRNRRFEEGSHLDFYLKSFVDTFKPDQKSLLTFATVFYKSGCLHPQPVK